MVNKTAIVALACALIILAQGCTLTTEKIAVISLTGPIQSERDLSLFGSAGITPSLVRGQLERASTDPTVKAVVIQVNSPGGEVSACEEIRYEMDKFKKPVVISMRTMAASGGYYISANADKIVALPTTNTGSIGVITYIPNLTGLFDKLGIKMEIVKSGKYKDIYSGFKELTDDELRIIQQNTDDAYELFIDVVARGRNLGSEEVRELATGQIFTGLQAKERGLVDEIGGLQTAIDLATDLAKVKEPKIEYYKPDSTSIFELLTDMRLNIFDEIEFPVVSDTESKILTNMLNNPYPRYLYR